MPKYTYSNRDRAKTVYHAPETNWTLEVSCSNGVTMIKNAKKAEKKCSGTGINDDD